MLALVLGLLLQVPPAPLTPSQIDPSEPLALAPRVLPPETLALIEGGQVWRVWVPGQMYAAQFWEAPRPRPDGFCSRRVHRVEMGKFHAPGDPEPTTDSPLALKDLGEDIQYAPAWPRPANEATCAGVRGYIALGAQTRDAELAMLGRLTDAMAQAAADDRLPFELSCVSENPAACEVPRAALAGLPLEALLGVRLKSNQYRTEPVRNGVRVRYALPVTDGRWPEAEIAFGSTGPDHQSWTITLKGVDRLASLEMRRSTIIRH
jgi:hypothetical protein